MQHRESVLSLHLPCPNNLKSSSHFKELPAVGLFKNDLLLAILMAWFQPILIQFGSFHRCCCLSTLCSSYSSVSSTIFLFFGATSTCYQQVVCAGITSSSCGENSCVNTYKCLEKQLDHYHYYYSQHHLFKRQWHKQSEAQGDEDLLHWSHHLYTSVKKISGPMTKY